MIAINPNDPDVVKEDGFKEMKNCPKEKFKFPYLLDEGQKYFSIWRDKNASCVFIRQEFSCEIYWIN